MKKKYLIPMLTLTIIFISIFFIPVNAKGDLEAEFKYSPRSPEVDEEVIFNASGSEGEDLVYKWDFGDGEKGEGMVVNHTYTEAGKYRVFLIVTNSTGEFDSYSKDINVYGSEVGWIWIIFTVAYVCGIYGFIFVIGMLAVANIILCGVLSYKAYIRGKENDLIDTAVPYIIAYIIAGLIGFFMAYFALFSIIAHLVIYVKFKNRMKEMGIDITKKMKNPIKKAKKKTKK